MLKIARTMLFIAALGVIVLNGDKAAGVVSGVGSVWNGILETLIAAPHYKATNRRR